MVDKSKSTITTHNNLHKHCADNFCFQKQYKNLLSVQTNRWTCPDGDTVDETNQMISQNW